MKRPIKNNYTIILMYYANLEKYIDFLISENEELESENDELVSENEELESENEELKENPIFDINNLYDQFKIDELKRLFKTYKLEELEKL